jgi:hypothetical protein
VTKHVGGRKMKRVINDDDTEEDGAWSENEDTMDNLLEEWSRDDKIIKNISDYDDSENTDSREDEDEEDVQSHSSCDEETVQSFPNKKETKEEKGKHNRCDLFQINVNNDGSIITIIIISFSFRVFYYRILEKKNLEIHEWDTYIQSVTSSIKRSKLTYDNFFRNE